MIKPFQVNTSPIDGWTIVHFVIGNLLSRFKVKRKLAYALITGTELIENVALRPVFPPYFDESTGNIIIDFTIGILGYETGKR